MRTTFSLSRQVLAAARPKALSVAVARPALAARFSTTAFVADNQSPEESVLGAAGGAKSEVQGFSGSSSARQTFVHLQPTDMETSSNTFSVDSLKDNEVAMLPIVHSTVYPGSHWHFPPADVGLRRTLIKETRERREGLPDQAAKFVYVYKTFAFDLTVRARQFHNSIVYRLKTNFNRALPVIHYDAASSKVTVGLPAQCGIGSKSSDRDAYIETQEAFRAYRDGATAEAEKREIMQQFRDRFVEYGFNSLYSAVARTLDHNAVYTNSISVEDLEAFNKTEGGNRNQNVQGDGSSRQRSGGYQRRDGQQRQGYQSRQPRQESEIFE